MNVMVAKEGCWCTSPTRVKVRAENTGICILMPLRPFQLYVYFYHGGSTLRKSRHTKDGRGLIIERGIHYPLCDLPLVQSPAQDLSADEALT